MTNYQILGPGEGCIDHEIVFEAGRQAREEAISIDPSAAALRMASFRRYLHSTVGSMSTLIPHVLAAMGSNVETALGLIRPVRQWPGITAFDTPRCCSAKSIFISHRWRTGDPHVDNYLFPLRMGTAQISDQSSGHWAEVMIAGGSVNLKFHTASFDLSIEREMARIQFAGHLPATIIAACGGRPLDELVDLPLTNGLGYLVSKATCSEKTSALEFATGRFCISMPW